MTSQEDQPGAGTLFVHGRTRQPAPISWDEIREIKEEPHSLLTPDILLEKGIGEYTFIPAPEGVLGRGKFSVVYKVVGPDDQFYALKHTPLHPHHPLIAARLLREPTLLAQLPPHPNLIGVQGIIRTQGHFYLVEKYASHHVPLPAHPLPLAPSRAAYILDQLVSVIRDCLHKSRVCHRDLKGENILIDLESGDLLILDLGLATQFAASEPKLTTCCGSPAFHSPEIVSALAHPPGAVTYYGPELDIWCIALTLLSLLLRIRFPIGPSHKHYSVMRSRIKDRLQELDEVYPPLAPWLVLPDHEKLSQADKAHEGAEWVRVRRAMRHFLEMDGKKRMQKFEAYEIGGRQVERLDKFGQCLEAHGGRALKSTSFIPAEVEYTLPLYLDLEHPIEDNEGTEGNKVIVLDNPTGMKARKALSYIRYLLRSAAIGYHCLSPHESDETIYQLVLPLRPTGAGISSIPPHVKPADPNSNRSSQQNPGSRNDRAESPNSRNSGTGWVASLNPFKRPSAARSVSLPAQRRSAPRSPPLDTGAEKKGKLSWLRIWIKIEFQSTPGYHDGSGSETPGRHYLTPLIGTQALPDLSLGGLGLGFSSARRPSPRRRTTTDRYPSTSRPSPLSRQVSPDRRSPTPSRASTNASSAQLRRARGKIIVHLSDPRGYEVLRSALDIKHSGLSDDGDGDGEASESSPVIIQVSRDAEEDQEEGERGRPRSKESTDSSVLLMSADRDKAKQDGLVGVQVVSDSDGESRSRKPGLWGLLTGTGLGLGSGSDGESTSSRSMSMPPAREAVV